jgi:hypothetical protein
MVVAVALALMVFPGVEGRSQPTIPQERIPGDAPADVQRQILMLYSPDVKERMAAIYSL